MITRPSGIREPVVYEIDSQELRERPLQRWCGGHLDALGLDLAKIEEEAELGTSKRADLICVDRFGALSIIEFKRDAADREALAQVLEYQYLLSEILHQKRLQDETKWWRNIEDVYVGRFGGCLPTPSKYRPSVVIVADNFEKEFKEMVAYYNLSHKFSVWLIQYKSTADTEISFTFTTVLRPGLLRRHYARVPRRTFVCRFRETGSIRWNDVLRSSKLPLPQQSLEKLRNECKAGKVTLLVDVCGVGYVAKTAVKEVQEHTTESALQVTWQHAVERKDAIHRRGIFRSDTDLKELEDASCYHYVTNSLKRLGEQDLSIPSSTLRKKRKNSSKAALAEEKSTTNANPEFNHSEPNDYQI